MRTLALLGVAAVWGWTFVLVKEGLSATGPFWFLALRFSLATLLALFLWRPEQGSQAVRRGMLLGVALFAGYFLQTWGLVYTTAQKSALITGLSVVLVPLLGHTAGLRAPWPTWVGAGCAAGGLALLVLGSREPLGPTGLGDLLTLGCAVAFAVYLLLLDRYAKQNSVRAMLAPQLATVAVLSWVGTLVWEQPQFVLPTQAWVAVLITGALASTVAFGLLSWVEQRTTAAYTAIVLTMEPVFAGVLGWLVLGETLVNWQIVGAITIVAGMSVPHVRRLTTPSSSLPTQPPMPGGSGPASS